MELELYHHQYWGVMWIPCPPTNTSRENVETPSAFQTSFLETMLGELGRLPCLETRHGAFSFTFRRRILSGGYIAWRILRSGTLEGPAGWSFDPTAEGAMTTARPPRSLIICPCLSVLSTDYCLSPCCHTLRRCSLTVRTLCVRREEWDHDPPAVTTSNLYFQYSSLRVDAKGDGVVRGA